MANANSPLNGQGRQIALYVGADGVARIPLVVGDKTPAGGTTHAGWIGVTHAQGDAVAAGDGVQVIAGIPVGSLPQNATPIRVDSEGRVLARVVPTGGAISDFSGSLVAGATSQELMPANTSRRYLLIINPSTATESLWIDFGTDAVVGSPSIELQPGGVFVMEGNFVSTDAINVIATTISHPFTAKEG